VIGSGIAVQRLSPGDTGLELLENAAATAAGLFAIIAWAPPESIARSRSSRRSRDRGAAS